MSKQRRNKKEIQEFIDLLKTDPGFYKGYYETIPERLLKHFEPGKQSDATLQAIKGQLPELEAGLKTVFNEFKGVEIFLRVKSDTIKVNKLFENLDILFGVNKGKERFIARDLEELTQYFDNLKEGKRKRRTTILSGHSIDQMLLKPEERIDPQVDMFGGVNTAPEKSPVTADNLKLDVGVEYIDDGGIGIKLSPGEHKVISVLQDLLSESIDRNPNTKQKEKGIPELGAENVKVTTVDAYNSGTAPYELPAPRISFNLYEIARRYKNGKIGGKDQAEVEAIIDKLDRTRVTIFYSFSYIQGGIKREGTIRYRDTILRKENVELKDTVLETGEVTKTKEIRAQLNPVFIHQIDTPKRIFRPEGISIRLSEAKRRRWGKTSLSAVDWNLYNELIRANSGTQKKDSTGNKTYEIYEENLLKKVAPDYYNPKHKKTGEARRRLNDAIETIKEEGLILAVKTEKEKYIFTLNKDYTKQD